jgi:hypothetical protein
MIDFDFVAHDTIKEPMCRQITHLSLIVFVLSDQISHRSCSNRQLTFDTFESRLLKNLIEG